MPRSSPSAVGTPALAVGYEPKVLGVMRDLGLADRVMAVDGTASAAAVTARIVELAQEQERSGHSLPSMARSPVRPVRRGTDGGRPMREGVMEAADRRATPGLLLAAIAMLLVPIGLSLVAPSSITHWIVPGSAAAIAIVAFLLWPVRGLVIFALYVLFIDTISLVAGADIKLVDELTIPVIGLITSPASTIGSVGAIVVPRDVAVVVVIGAGVLSSLIDGVGASIWAPGLLLLVKGIAIFYIARLLPVTDADVRWTARVVLAVGIVVLALGFVELVAPSVFTSIGLRPSDERHFRRSSPCSTTSSSSAGSVPLSPCTCSPATSSCGAAGCWPWRWSSRWARSCRPGAGRSWVWWPGSVSASWPGRPVRRASAGRWSGAGPVIGRRARPGGRVPARPRRALPDDRRGLRHAGARCRGRARRGRRHRAARHGPSRAPARLALLETSVKIAVDRFPLGAGLGRFGSWMSRTHYSDVYAEYGLDRVFGLSPQNPQFITDTTWPQILGETGVVGLAGYCVFLASLGFSLWRVSRRTDLAPLAVAIVLGTGLTSAQTLVESLASPIPVNSPSQTLPRHRWPASAASWPGPSDHRRPRCRRCRTPAIRHRRRTRAMDHRDPEDP